MNCTRVLLKNSVQTELKILSMEIKKNKTITSFFNPGGGEGTPYGGSA